MKQKFNTKVAKNIANTSFLYVLDCIRGISDSGYSLSTTSDEFIDNFSEDLQELGIAPTDYRISVINKYYDKLIADLDAYVSKKYPKKEHLQ